MFGAANVHAAAFDSVIQQLLFPRARAVFAEPKNFEKNIGRPTAVGGS
jgi:hypothetical protein